MGEQQRSDISIAGIWLSPMIERAGTQFLYSAPRATYKWFGSLGMSTSMRILLIIPVGFVELLLATTVAKLILVRPTRTLFGRRSALTTAIKENFTAVEFTGSPEVQV